MDNRHVCIFAGNSCSVCSLHGDLSHSPVNSHCGCVDEQGKQREHRALQSDTAPKLSSASNSLIQNSFQFKRAFQNRSCLWTVMQLLCQLPQQVELTLMCIDSVTSCLKCMQALEPVSTQR